MTKNSIYSDFNSDVKYLDERLPFNIKGAPVRDWDGIYNERIRIVQWCKSEGIL